eukprot:4004077-Pleurochrysis_carterae.AAC.3
MADACNRGHFQELYACCARLGVHPKRFEAPPGSPPSSALSCPSTKSSTSTCSRSPVTSRYILGPPMALLRSRTLCERCSHLPRLFRPSCALLRLLPCCRE